MTCFRPIKAFIVEENNGERKYHFEPCTTERIVYKGQAISKHILLPCGKCAGCKTDRSRDWANRMMLELKYHDCACFITLTYNEDNVPFSDDLCCDEFGEVHQNMTLRKEDFQKFMKRLRKAIAPVKIRYFACGEYGPKNHRPHYHAIIFGYDFPDKVPYQVDENYNVTYRSPLLEKLWNNPKTKESLGFSLVADVNWKTCAYVARYCVKKMEPLPNIYYQTFKIEPEFNLMSRRPGIGRQYYEEHKDKVYIRQEIFLSDFDGGKKIPLPRYFDRLYGSEHPEEMKRIKEERSEIAQRELENKLREQGKDLASYLRDCEENFRMRIRYLKREKA